MARPAAVALSVAVLCAALAAPASAGWSRPFRFAQPATLDILPAQIGFSPAGAAAVTFGIEDADNPTSFSGLAALRQPGGALVAPRSAPGMQRTLDLVFAHSSFELLNGASPSGLACCSSAEVLSLTPGGVFGRPRTLVGDLSGATVGRLTALDSGRLVAAMATEQGVWVAQSDVAARFAAAHRLTPPGARPQALGATSLPGDQSFVAWTATSGYADGAGPRTIFVATGSRLRAPSGRRAAVTVPSGHSIDELGLVSGASAPTLAWIESWFDGSGSFRSQAVVEDLAAGASPRSFPIPGQLASGLTISADAAGDQVLAWKGCTSAGTCTVWLASRGAGGRFGSAAPLGATDASEAPTVRVGPNGAALAGWISNGHVFAASRHRAGPGFGAPDAVSRTNFATDLTLAFGPAGQAIAAWTQGTLAPSVVGAVYRTQ